MRAAPASRLDGCSGLTSNLHRTHLAPRDEALTCPTCDLPPVWWTPQARGIVASMSRKGDCQDNAVTESFFATIQAEEIEHFHNIPRRHARLGYFNPIEFESQSQVVVFAA